MEHYIEIKRHLRYYTNDCPSPQRVLFVLHGYGQHPKYFIRKFKVDEHTLVIAPEGLHRYYLEGYSGRVGCSWMTREDRLQDIADYVAYLDQIAGKTASDFGEIPIHCLGFSQGAATASRWVVMGNTEIKSLSLWCGVFPPDLPPVSLSKLNQIKCSVVYALADEFATEAEIKKQITNFEQSGIKFDTLTLAGNHDIKPHDFYNFWTALLNQTN